MNNRNGMSNRRKGRRTAQVPGRVSTDKQRHRLEFRGIVGRGPADPPRVLLTPWNTITLTTLLVGTAAPSNVCLAVADLTTQFTAQTGIAVSSGTGYTFRILSSQAWHIIPNGELNNRVRCRYYSLINETTTCSLVHVLAALDDYGTPARNATTKFTWPLTHSSNVFTQTSTETVMRFTLDASQQVLIHTRILWKPQGGTATITRVQDDGTLCVVRDEVSALFSEELENFERLSI